MELNPDHYDYVHHALLIGVNEFSIDAISMHDTLNKVSDFGVCKDGKKRITLLHDDAAQTGDGPSSREYVHQAILNISLHVTEESFVIFYFSGHGSPASKTAAVSLQDLRVEQEELAAWLRPIRAKRVLLIFDCCYAESLLPKPASSDVQTVAAKPDPDDPFVKFQWHNVELGGEGWLQWAATKAETQAAGLEDARVSRFTHLLLAALEGAPRCPKEERKGAAAGSAPASASPSAPVYQGCSSTVGSMHDDMCGRRTFSQSNSAARATAAIANLSLSASSPSSMISASAGSDSNCISASPSESTVLNECSDCQKYHQHVMVEHGFLYVEDIERFIQVRVVN